MDQNRSSSFAKRGKYLFFFLGALLFVFLIREVGWEKLLSELKLIGWGLIPVIFIHGLKEALTTSAWQAAFPGAKKFNWWTLYFILSASAAVNKIYHTGILGGEITKIAFVRREVTAQEAVASVLIAKLAKALAKTLFILSGIFFMFPILDFPPILETVLLVVFSMLVILILTFWLMQRRGLLGFLIKVFEKTPLPAPIMEKMRRQTGVLDEHMRVYHHSQSGKFWWAVFLNMARILLGLVQIQLLLYFLGVPGGFLRCFYISAFSALVSTLFFFIPGHLGVQEGGKIVIAKALGMTTAQGMSLGIASRLTQIMWSLLGLVVLFLWKKPLKHFDKNGEVTSEPI